MPIFLCATDRALESCIAQFPGLTYCLLSDAPPDAMASVHTGAVQTIGWQLWLAEPSAYIGTMVIAVDAATIGAPEQAELAGLFAGHSRRGHALFFARPAISLAGQTLGAPAHASALPAVVFVAGTVDPSLALGAGLMDGSNRHRCVLMLDGDVCAEYDIAGQTLQINGRGTTLVATPPRGAPTLASATLDVLTEGMTHTLA